MSKIYIVGMGPGAYDQMTIKAAETLKSCDVIVGYTVYVELLKKYFPEKEFLTTPMRQEILRCKRAFEEAGKGRIVAMACSGDAGIYGMAGLMFELSKDHPDIEIEVIPGVTAALSGAAVLGSPLGNDCALISLSDLMTDWEIIKKRLLAAAEADLAIALYNPSSKKRKDYLNKACEILLTHKPAETVCGIVRNIGREGEEMSVLTLGELKRTSVDMFCTVFIGNAQTKIIGGRMVTPRGYQVSE